MGLVTLTLTLTERGVEHLEGLGLGLEVRVRVSKREVMSTSKLSRPS